VDKVHFVPIKKGHLFKLPKTLGPFIVNNRRAVGKVHKALEDMPIRGLLRTKMGLLRKL